MVPDRRGAARHEEILSQQRDYDIRRFLSTGNIKKIARNGPAAKIHQTDVNLPVTSICLSSQPVPIFTRADPFPGRAQRETGVFHGSFQKRRSVVVQVLLRKPNPCAPKGLSDHMPLNRYH